MPHRPPKDPAAASRVYEARLEAVLESVSDGFYAVDAEWRFTYVNRVAESWWDRPREDLLGRSIWEVFPGLAGSTNYKAHMEAARTRQVVRAEFVSSVRERWVDLSIFPSETGLSVYFKDITERKL